MTSSAVVSSDLDKKELVNKVAKLEKELEIFMLSKLMMPEL